jgi:hypothetical protein
VKAEGNECEVQASSTGAKPGFGTYRNVDRRKVFVFDKQNVRGDGHMIAGHCDKRGST